MTVSVLATFKGKDDTYEKLKQSFKDALNETKNYEGCQYVGACSDDKDKAIILYEVWDSRDHQEKYIKYIHSIKSGYIIDNNSSHQRNGKFKKKGLISKPFNQFINNFENINNYKTNTNPQYNNITYYWK